MKLKRRTSMRARVVKSYNDDRGEDVNDDDSTCSSDDESQSESSSDSEVNESIVKLERLETITSSPRKTRSSGGQSSQSQSQGISTRFSRHRDRGRDRDREHDSMSVASVASVKSATLSNHTSRPGTPSDRNGLLTPDQDVEAPDSDWSPGNGVPNGVVRRSTRMRNTRFNSLNQSWILGGGGGARGYPTRNSSKETTEQEGETERNDDAPPPIREESEDEEVNQGGESSGDDMYGRVKDPRRRRSSRRVINYREGVNSMAVADPAEPVSRRLRDRTHTRKIVNIINEHQARNVITNRRSSHLGRRRRKRRFVNSSSSSSSDSDDYCSQSQKRHGSHKEKERNVSRKTFMGDIQPLAVDSSITFASVGGLDNYVNKMKEIVIFPLIYKEFFTSRNIAPPRGILFHGPPGTGKTLLARALANECSVIGGKTVSFFMRKGADILNKWIGESERQLKLLFEQASIHQPSIIFFDELDGLAPVRSAKTDQVHNSIVSTLLAELDGVKDRGDIIVIGATNRVDSIDPALRRPGRFDHEFPFFLPSHESRRSILNVHLKDWKDTPVADYFVDQLADMTVGYSGADLRLLCSEANMCALRRRYPQIYASKEKLVLNYSSVQVERRDWETAMTIISRSSDRSIFSSSSTGSPLPNALKPLLGRNVTLLTEKLEKIFPYRSPTMKEPSRKRILVYAESIELSEHILPAALHTMDSIPVYTLSIQSLALNESDGKGVALLFGEATKRSIISVIYIPNIDKVYQVLGESGQQILLSELSKTAFSPVLILASAKEILPEELAAHFAEVSIRLPKPSTKERREFFKPIFEKNALQVKWTGGISVTEEVLPIAPPEVKTWTPAEIAVLEKNENRTIVQLKMFLRETIHKIARMKKFVEFTKPVNVEEVPDYLQIITDPMDLETMMIKVNQGKYLTKADFNKDIELIVTNALNYNPEKSETDMRIRHRAFELRDFVFIELEEMDSDFDEKCCKIQEAREERQKIMKSGVGVKQEKTDPAQPSSSSQSSNEVRLESRPRSPKMNTFKRRRISSWSKGITPTPKKFAKKVHILDSSLSSSELPASPRSPYEQIDLDTSQDGPMSPKSPKEKSKSRSPTRTRSPSASCSTASSVAEEKPDDCGFIKSNKSAIYVKDLQILLDLLVERTSLCNTRQLLELRFQLLRTCEQHSMSHDKKELLVAVREIIEKIKQHPTTNSTKAK